MAKSIVDILFGLSFALILTILIEWGLSFLFLRSKADRRLVVLVQCLTNPALNTLLLINNYFGLLNGIVLIIFLEFCVVVIEAIIYKKGQIDARVNPFLLSLLLNLASVSVGLLIGCFVR